MWKKRRGNEKHLMDSLQQGQEKRRLENGRRGWREDDKFRSSWRGARRDFQPSTCASQLSSVSAPSHRIRPLGPRVQRHRVLDDNFLFTGADSLREYSFYANNALVTVLLGLCNPETSENVLERAGTTIVSYQSLSLTLWFLGIHLQWTIKEISMPKEVVQLHLILSRTLGLMLRSYVLHLCIYYQILCN